MKDVRASIKEAEQAVADTKLLQKINATHREAFRLKYPGQVEHCLRLVMERLHVGLDKRDGVDVADSTSWRLNAQEIAHLTASANVLHLMLLDLKTKE